MGAEALIRWQKSDGTIMNPGSFIPIFEQNGMIRILDEYVFRNVCNQQKKWLSEGKNIVPVSVNLSRASLYYKNVVQQYTYITQEIDLDRQYVPIEITETAAITNNEIIFLFRLHHHVFLMLLIMPACTESFHPKSRLISLPQSCALHLLPILPAV